MLLRAPAMVAMAVLTSPGLYALRLHSPAKATAHSLPHKSIPSFELGRTTDTCTRRETTRSSLERYPPRRTIVAVSREHRYVVASWPRAQLTLRLHEKPICKDRSSPCCYGVTVTTVAKMIAILVLTGVKKRTPTRLTFYYSHPLRSVDRPAELPHSVVIVGIENTAASRRIFS